MTGLDQIDEVLTALADPMRRRVLDGVAARGEATATELAGELPVSRQAVVRLNHRTEDVGPSSDDFGAGSLT
jgi:DNA-binding transcriptional ArsR family regulator